MYGEKLYTEGLWGVNSNHAPLCAMPFACRMRPMGLYDPPFQHWLASDTLIHLVPYGVLYGSWQPTRLSGWYWVEGPDRMAPHGPCTAPPVSIGGHEDPWLPVAGSHGFRGLPYGGHGGPVVARVNGDHGDPVAARVDGTRGSVAARMYGCHGVPCPIGSMGSPIIWGFSPLGLALALTQCVCSPLLSLCPDHGYPWQNHYRRKILQSGGAQHVNTS